MTFCLIIKDGTFFPPFLCNESGTGHFSWHVVQNVFAMHWFAVSFFCIAGFAHTVDISMLTALAVHMAILTFDNKQYKKIKQGIFATHVATILIFLVP
jgi:hypothetical protein